MTEFYYEVMLGVEFEINGHGVNLRTELSVVNEGG